MSKQKDITREEVPGRVHQALMDEFGDGQKQRVQGAFISTSLRKVMEFLDPESIHSVKIERETTQKKTDIPIPESFDPFTKVNETRRLELRQRYDKKEDYHDYPWKDIREWLDETPEIHDLSISELVFKIENDDLRDQLLRVLQKAIGFSDSGEFESPFFAVMKSCPPGDPSTRRAIRDYHEDYYFQSTDQTDGDMGMNWPIRSLDLVGLWSHRAWADSSNQPFYGMTMRDVENLAINHIGSDAPEYGAINSKLVVNRWRSHFSRGTTQFKAWVWVEDQKGWKRVGPEEVDQVDQVDHTVSLE